MVDLIAESGRGQQQHRDLLQSLIKKIKGTTRIASAYVTDTDLLSGVKNRDVRLLTYLSQQDIIVGATSLRSLAVLIKAGVRCRYLSGKPRLHAKVYIFADQSAVVTSANLTWRALDKNIEVGILVGGEPAHELSHWFDTLWKNSDELDLATLSRWQRETALQRAEFLALWKKLEKQPMLPSEARPSVRAAKRLRDLFQRTNRFFVCNTDRKWSPEAEEGMHNRKYAVAWEEFRYPTHMDRVRKGHAIFMYAKGAGIIGIGRAKARCQVLTPDDPDRIRKKHKPEWRVPVNWLAWKKDRDAFPWPSPNSTFFEVSEDNYSDLRDGIQKHFLSHQ